MVDSTGDDERLAPVIPLFGAGSPAKGTPSSSDKPSSGAAGDAGAGAWRSTWHDSGAVAAGTPFPERGAASAEQRHPAGKARASTADAFSGDGTGARRPARLRALVSDDAAAGGAGGDLDEGDPEEAAVAASEALVRKLRARSMSVAEATTFLRGRQLSAEQVMTIIDEFTLRKYLDDGILAGHLVTSGHERKGQGRVALARALAQRGIPRDVADAALAELPDDDFERALEFARSKMRSLGRLDAETAKRRLSGQLARRGYGGGLVSQVVRQAMDESFSRGGSSGVRFE